MDRTINVGSSAEQAISYGFTGPNLRAAGVDYDVRIAQPYSFMTIFDFIIPVGTGDTMIVFAFVTLKFQKSIIRQLGKKLKEMNFMLTFLTITYLQKKMFTPYGVLNISP
jgi:NADH-quinone oxidoreductase subunit D